MSWASFHIEKLQKGETVLFRPVGNSMIPLIKSRQLVTITPITKPLQINDIVLCKVKGNVYLHKITAIKDDQYQISNNKGYVNGWTNIKNIFGICVKVES